MVSDVHLLRIGFPKVIADFGLYGQDDRFEHKTLRIFLRVILDIIRRMLTMLLTVVVLFVYLFVFVLGPRI